MENKPSIQHKPTLKASAFAIENDSCVPKEDFDFDAVEDREEHEARLDLILSAKEETQRRIFALLLDGNPDAIEAGMRIHLLAYRLGLHPAKTQRQLAAQLKVSQGTISNLITKNINGRNGFAVLLRSLINHSAH